MFADIRANGIRCRRGQGGTPIGKIAAIFTGDGCTEKQDATSNTEMYAGALCAIRQHGTAALVGGIQAMLARLQNNCPAGIVSDVGIYQGSRPKYTTGGRAQALSR